MVVAPSGGFAGSLQRAGSRPGWRVTFLFDDKKVTKETSFELCELKPAADQAEALRLACPARTACPWRAQSLQLLCRSADRRLNKVPHVAIWPCHSGCVPAMPGVARPWTVRCDVRPPLFEPDRRGARLDEAKHGGLVGKFKKGFLIQTFGPAKVWSPAGARPGALQRTGEATAWHASQRGMGSRGIGSGFSFHLAR